jgi:hypothetical protein
MGVMNQWTGGFNNSMPAPPDLGHHFFGSSMRGDHHRLGSHQIRIAFDPHPTAPQFSEDSIVVDQVTEDSQGTAGGFLICQGDGVSDPKTHAEMMSTMNFHGESTMTLQDKAKSSTQ